jgi:hypothetical protein
VLQTCDWTNYDVPEAVNGGYCFEASAGDWEWASFATWEPDA